MAFVDHPITCYLIICLGGSKEFCFMVTCRIGVLFLLVYLGINFRFPAALYVNDLPSVVEHYILDLYANDAELHCSHSDLHTVATFLQSDLDSVLHV